MESGKHTETMLRCYFIHREEITIEMLQISKLCRRNNKRQKSIIEIHSHEHTNRNETETENENEQQHSQNNKQINRRMDKPAIQTLEPISKIRIQQPK